MGRPLLGVERSLNGQPWHERLDESGHGHALAMVQRHGVPDLVARVLAGRGVTPDGCQSYLQPTVRELMPDPSALVDMDAAAERLSRAVLTGEKVAIFGDYDVDGACSAALLGSYLRAAGLHPRLHIPDRLLEGYGPNEAAIASLAADGATLLVTVDCGTTSAGPLAAAHRLGLDVIVLDHHRATAELPAACAIVNPNRLDDLSGLGHLCAAGVVFMALAALTRRLRAAGFWNGRAAPDLLASLDLVALATVADVVPLLGLNRAFVSKGLAVMHARSRPGLRALFDVAKTNGPPSAFHLGFLIGPRINAGGRIGDAGLGARLLMCDDEIECQSMAAQLDRLNKERRVVEGVAVEQAEAEALAGLDPSQGRFLLCHDPAWHPGVVGLVAARLRERFDRPAFALAVSGDIATGSARSIPGVDLGAIVHAAVAAGILIKGGGHAMAAGLTLSLARISDFRIFLHDQIGDEVEATRATARLHVDATLTARGLTPETVEHIESAGPFGAGNPEPVVAFAAHRLRAAEPVGTDHIRIRAEAADGAVIHAVAFRAADTPLGQGLRRALGRPMHLAGTVSLNRWGGGQGRAELRLLDAALAE